MRLSYAVLPVLLTVRLRPWLPAGIRQVHCHQGTTLATCWQQFQQGNIRLILAFRHTEVDDPLSAGYLFSRWLPRLAQQAGIPLQRPLHSHFLYDRGMTLWAGKWLGWFFSSLGGIPVHRGRRLDLTALKTLREILMKGQFPLAIAPEGATNGHGERISPLEPGAAQFAFWCVEDLQKAHRSEQVILLPIGVQYHYPHPDWRALDRLMTQLERDMGLPVMAIADPDQASAEVYCERLLRLGTHLLGRMEQFYHRFFHQPLAPLARQEGTPGVTPGDTATGPIPASPPENFEQRLADVLDKSLAVGEQFFGLPSTGNLITRCRRLEEAGWMWIYREDIPAISALSAVDRGLADWIAQLATLQMRHMRLVESLVAVTDQYVREKPSFERFTENTLILFDLVERIKGTKVPSRPRMGWRHSTLTIGEPINVSDRWLSYAQGRSAAKQSVEQLTQDLQKAMENLIHP